MKRARNIDTTVCPVARSTEIVGDRWTLLILRELYMGASRFDDIQIQTEATPQMLTTRLKALQEDGMVERHPYNPRPLRYEYRLTEKGKAFYPVIHALRAWGETWCKGDDEEIAVHLIHRTCGHEVGLDNICPVCGVEVQRQDLDARLSDAFTEEREARRSAARAGKD